MQSDEQLAEAALQGDDAAFGELVQRYRERLFRFLLTRCRSRADAEDALQDTFINAYRYLGSFNSRWRFSTWLYRIGVRNALKQQRPETGTATDVADDNADPLGDCIRASDRENLWVTARDALSPDAYTALWLRYVEDLSIREIAAAMERNTSWTKVTLLRARNRLGQALEASGAESAEGEVYG
jgi:RNA polymerase sigma-70 factor (ECF subfamily)